MRWLHLLVMVAVLEVGCIPPAPLPPGPDPQADAQLEPEVEPPASYPPTVKGACAKLSFLQCEEGGANCEKDLQHMVDTELTPVDLACIAGAESKQQERLCPGVMGDDACP